MSKAAQDFEYFSRIPWCAEQLGREGVTIWSPPWKVDPERAHDDPLFSATLNHPKRVPALVYFYEEKGAARLEVVKALVALGDDVCGYPGLVHGAMISTMFDTVLGTHSRINHDRGAITDSAMTAHLNTKFHAALRAPCVVLVTSTIDRFEGRKCFMHATIQGSDGKVYATAESLWIVRQAKL